MGNTHSEEGEDDLENQEMLKPEESSSTSENLLDFSSLFDREALHKSLLNVKEPPGSILYQRREVLVKWLKTLVERDETTVNMVQFVDYLTSKGASKEEAIESFRELDMDGEGSLEIVYLLNILKETPPDPMQAFMKCTSLPGPLDVYLEDKNAPTLARKLLRYILRQRVDSDKLVSKSLSQIHSNLESRIKLVNGRYILLVEKEKDQELLGVSEEGSEEGMERVFITKCYSKVSVSSTPRSVDNLLDSHVDTYWQSNGSPRSHWIRIQMLPGVMLKELAVSVNSSDDSYMPKNLSVLVGNTETNLREIKTAIVPRELNGRFVLMQNLGSEHRYIQINIKGCHSDGCDCRIRGLHIKGCKYTIDIEPTVLDTISIWYLGIVASTAKAAMPVAPHLREMILSQSKSALRSLHPLSLSPRSPAKPTFLSPFVIAEMDKFLTTICLPEENFVTVDAECYQVLLSFALAHGTVNTILDILRILIDNFSLELPVAPLLRKMDDIQKLKLHKHAENIKMSLLKCDGGQKDDKHKPESILNPPVSGVPSSSSTSYISDTGHKVVNLVVHEESSQLMKVSKISIKVEVGDHRPKAVIVFLTSTNPTEEGRKENLEQYDTWTAEDFQKMENGEETEDKEWVPIAYLEPTKETGEAEFVPSDEMIGKYLIFKLLSEEEAERVGVNFIKVLGHKTSAEEMKGTSSLSKLNSIAPLPADSNCVIGGDVVLIRVLAFMTDLLRDLECLQKRRKAASLDPSVINESHLAVENLSLEKIWSLYIPLTLNSTMEYPSVLCLYLLRTALPFIKPTKFSSDSSSSSSGNNSVPSAILKHLCGFLDSPDVVPVIQRLAQDIVVEGVVIFFPDAKARKDYLLEMISAVLDSSQPKSWWLKFEALCHYFSQRDSNSILDLPQNVDKDQDVNTDTAMNILSTMLTVAKKQSLDTVKSGVCKPNDLMKLLSALQASMFYWCKNHISVTDQAALLLLEYVSKLVEDCLDVLREVDLLDPIPENIPEILEKSLLSRVLPEMLVFLHTIAGLDVNYVKLVNALQPLLTIISDITAKLPHTFLKVDDEVLTSADAAESVVGVWTRESPHNYENNSRINEDFVCSSATKFVIEFDPRCHTERRYDYLEFTDSGSRKQRFDGEVSGDRWPKKAEFKGQKLHFVFYSDGSNNEWGYKFTIKAYGHTLPEISWMFDLQISLSHLLGLLCSCCLSTKQLCRVPQGIKSDEEKEEESFVDSDLWKTLFRGGYLVGRLTRSLSGAYAASPADSALSAVLQDLANGPEGDGVKLLEMCRNELKAQYYGGPQVDKAVSAVFAALIWHTQDIREELAPYVSSIGDMKLTPGLLGTYKTAEAMRRELVEARQKLLEEKEKEEDEEKKTKIIEDAPVTACHEKAIFLLKFSGISRVAKDQEGEMEKRPSWAQKGKKWQRLSTAVSTVGKLKQRLHETEKLSEKYPSFELVLNFVKNDALTVDKVHSLLQQREKLAKSVASVYYFIAEYIQSIREQLFELPGLAFLQQLLAKQRRFPIHYAAKVDGCGLELENQLRKAYRLVVQRLMYALDSFKKPTTQEHRFSRLLVLLYTTHLLDFEWQDYDNSLLAELQLPEFYFENAIKCSGTEESVEIEKFEGEDEMMKHYLIHMELLKEFKEMRRWKDLFDLDIGRENKKDAHLFLVCMAHKFPDKVSLQCDGCSSTIKGQWYRDIDREEDLDLCTQCFESGEGNRPDDHSEDHVFQLLGSYCCDDCGMSIVTHRFRSNTRPDFDLCLGCFRKEEATGKTDDWTVYFLTEQTSTKTAKKVLTSESASSSQYSYNNGVLVKMGAAMDFMVYSRLHCSIMFTTLCLNMANAVNNTNAPEADYIVQACQLKLECLKLLSFTLRATLVAKYKEVKSSDGSKDKDSVQVTEEQGEPDREGTPPVEVQPQRVEVLVRQLSHGSRSSSASHGSLGRVETDSTPPPPASEEKKSNDSKATTTADGGSPVQKIVEEDPIVVASKQYREIDARIGVLERTYAVLTIDVALGVLAAVLPQELSLSRWIQCKGDVEVFLAEDLLPNLLQLASCRRMNQNLRFQCLVVAAQYMARVNPEVADRAIAIAHGQTVPSDVGEKTKGRKTTNFLFNTGAFFLKRSNFAGAAASAECLLILTKALPWKSAITVALNEYLNFKPQDMDLSSVFGLLVLAGFPKLPREGSVFSKPNTEDKPQIAVLTTPKADSGIGIDSVSRDQIVISYSKFEVQDTLKGCVDSSRLDVLLPLIDECARLIKQDSERQLENVWILGQCLKAVNIIVQSNDSEFAVTSLLKANLVPVIVQLASKPTNFSQKWLLDDLEVLGISNYRPTTKKSEPAVNEKAATKEDKKKSEQEEEETDADKETEEGKDTVEQKETEEPKDLEESTTEAGEDKPPVEEESKTPEEEESKPPEEEESKPPEEEESKPPEEEESKPAEGEGTKSTEAELNAHILEGLPEDAQEMLKVLVDVFLCKLSVLRAMYDQCDGDLAKFMANSEQYFSESGFKPSDEILEASKQWERGHVSVKEAVQDIQESMEDMGVTKLTPVDVDIKSIEAISEDAAIFKKQKSLFEDEDSKTTSQEDKSTGGINRQDSYKLLQDELTKLKESGPPNREDVCRMFQGIVVLHARQVLASLLSYWPKGGLKLSSTFLGCVDITHYFCLLDLLLKQHTEEDRKKILSTVLQCGETTEVVSLAVTAAQCMREVSISKETRDFRHCGEADGKLKRTGKIVIPSASSMIVSFHSVNGSLQFSSQEDFSEHLKKQTSTEDTDPEKKMKHVIPGNTVHYEVVLNPVTVAKYPKCSFTVIGTQMGRLDTGHSILHALFCEESLARCLPLSQVWIALIAAACQHTGAERLKVVCLLMKLLNIHGSGTTEDVVKEKLELSALKPLWQLYTTMIKKFDSEAKTKQLLAPELIRVFTELFLTVEDLSEEWGVSQDLMIETLTKEGLHTWLEKGISNVAFISIALGLDNLASSKFIEAKKTYVPPHATEETDGPSSSIRIFDPIGFDNDDDDDDDDDNSALSDDTTDDTDDDDEYGANSFSSE